MSYHIFQREHAGRQEHFPADNHGYDEVKSVLAVNAADDQDRAVTTKNEQAGK